MAGSVNKKKVGYSRRIQSVVVIIMILSAAGYYFFRFIANANLIEVVPGKVYRSAQPSDANLKKWVNNYGIKTVINLRAKKPKDFEQEKLAGQQLGIKLIPLYLSGSRLVSRPELLTLIEALETARIPLLIHCESGIDRAGFAAALAAVAIGHVDFDTAKEQAYVPPGPWKREDFSQTRGDYVYDYAHISDTLKLYENYCRNNNIDENDWQQFKQWAAELPDMEDMNVEYEPVYSYFPFMGNDKHFFPLYKLLKGAYIQFPIEILIVVLLIYYTKFCLKAAKRHRLQSHE